MSVLRRFFGALLLGLVALTAVGFATGRLASVVTNGTSMRPGYAAGDLVVVLASDRYSVGDVVAYHDDDRGEVVLHRIVGGTADAYRLRGDANQSTDVVTPSADDLIGREVLHLPRVGRWIGSPLTLALLAGIAIALSSLAAFTPATGAAALATSGPLTSGPASSGPASSEGADRARRGVTHPVRRHRRPIGRWRWWHVSLLALDVAVVSGLVAAMLVPPRVIPPPPMPMHVGSLSYRAVVPVGDAYPDGVVETGDTVFSRLTGTVDVTFRYEGDPATASNARLRTVVEAAGGWTSASALAPLTPVVAGGAELHGTLDLDALRSMLQRVQDTTGVTLTTVQLRVEALVEPEPSSAVTGPPTATSTNTTVTPSTPSTPYQLVMQFRFDELGLDLAETSVVTASLDGPVVTSSEPARATVEEPREVGGVPRAARRWLLVALLVLVAASVTSWPDRRPTDDARDDDRDGDRDGDRDDDSAEPAAAGEVPGASDGPSDVPARRMRAQVTRVASVDLPPVSLRVQLAERRDLDQVAIAAGVPVLERDDGWAAVLTDQVLHWWEPPSIPASRPRWESEPATSAPPSASLPSAPSELVDVWAVRPAADDLVAITPTVPVPVIAPVDPSLPVHVSSPDDGGAGATVEREQDGDAVERLRETFMVPRRPLFRARPLPAPAPAAPGPVASAPVTPARPSTETSGPGDVTVRSTIDEIVAYLSEVADRR